MKLYFKRDTIFRKQFFTPESFAHPAKMDSHLLLWIVGHYTEVGETILDPMAGMGTTMLACTLGRNVVLVELEEKFCKMCHDNWEIVKTKPQLGSTLGDCQIIQGDARQLEGLLVDKIVTSPPYTHRMDGGIRGSRAGMVPYTDESPDAWYTQRDQKNIGNLPYGQIDKIVTSPPYAERHSYPDVERERHAVEKLKAHPDSKIGGSRIHEHCSENPNNIGNLKSQSYLEAMLQVYQQCRKVLKPGGLMILVTKNFIREKQVVRLDEDTIKLCEQAGFSFVERHYRKLPAQSFWRIIYHQKYPEVEQIKYEDILVLKKDT